MLDMTEPSRDRSVGQWLRLGLTAGLYLAAGLVLLALAGWDVHADAIVQSDPIWTTLLENLVTLAIGAAVTGVGVWVVRRGGGESLAPVGRWTAVTAAFILGVTALVLGTQALQTHWKPWMMFANFTGGLLLAGFYVGLYATWLQHKAYVDPLTGLANRNRLLERLRAAIRHADRIGAGVTVFHVDLDHFKDINEGFGAEAGDQLIRLVARRLEDTLSPEQSLARLGGDELVVLATDIEKAGGVEAIAHRIKQTFLEPVNLDKQRVRIQASVGIASYPRDADDPEELLRRSDAAVRQAKRSGGNQWAYYRSELIREAANRVVVGGRLRRAMENGDIRVAYQPIVSLEDEAVIGYEALARWYDPQAGWIPPDQFIPVAEDNGLIEELAETVTRAACTGIGNQSRDGAGRRPFISVNVSPMQIHRPDFAARLKALCSETGIAPEQLVIEVTEQALLGLDSETLSRLQEVRGHGVSVAIDDFGTGYASFSYLKHLPADRLKVDRKFISEVESDHGNQAIAAATLTLAREFGLSQTAEGVETRAEADKLKEMGYTSAQGYFFGKPHVPEAA